MPAAQPSEGVASEQARQVLREAIEPSRDWHGQIADALLAYLGALAGNHLLLSALYIAILGRVPKDLPRGGANRRIVQFLVRVVAVPASGGRLHAR